MFTYLYSHSHREPLQALVIINPSVSSASLTEDRFESVDLLLSKELDLWGRWEFENPLFLFWPELWLLLLLNDELLLLLLCPFIPPKTREVDPGVVGVTGDKKAGATRSSSSRNVRLSTANQGWHMGSRSHKRDVRLKTMNYIFSNNLLLKKRKYLVIFRSLITIVILKLSFRSEYTFSVRHWMNLVRNQWWRA